MDEHNADPTPQPQQPPPYMPGIEPIDIVCGHLRPLYTRSAKISGVGQIRLRSRLLELQVRTYQDGKAALIAIVLAIATSLVCCALEPELGPTGVAMALPIFLLWYLLVCPFLSKDEVLQIDTATHAFHYVQKKRGACLQLPDGRWIAIQARDKNRHEELRIALDRIYRGNVIVNG